jgi:hypothetical protein
MASRQKKPRNRPAPEKDPRVLERARDRLDQVRLLYENPVEKDSFLEGLALELEADPPFASFFLHQVVDLPDPWNGSLLQELIERVTAKPLRRGIKGGIYQLRQRGREVRSPEKEPGGRRGVLRQTETQSPEGYLSDFDNLGNRLLALVLPQVPQGRILVFGLMNWDRGLQDLSALEVSKKQVRALLEETENQSGQRFHPVDAGHGVYLLREAHGQAGRLKAEDEKVYGALNNYLETMGPFPSEPNLNSLSPGEEGEGEKDREWDYLKEIPELAGFHLPPEEMGPYGRSLLEIKESPLVLSPAQQEDRFREVIAGAVKAIFREERVRRLVRFLEEIAAAYWLKGRPEQARRILAALNSFERERAAALDPGHPLLAWLVRKEFLPAEGVTEDQPAPEEERTEGGLILPAWVKK